MTSFVLLLWGCTGPSPCPTFKKNHVSYGWRGGNFLGEWDDYYACALSYIDGEFYLKALDCLDQAIKQRSADQRMARTYGMHFIDDYFPNREIGIIHFLMGQYRFAEKSLLLSLEQEPSAKAYYYLDEVRKALMEENQSAASRPDISITSPSEFNDEDGFYKSNRFPMLMTGAVSDSRYVSWITIDGKTVFMEGSRKKMQFSEALYFEEGAHTIEIAAGNLMGGTSRKRIKFLMDKSGPFISITRIRPGQDIFGYLHDASGIARFTMNGRDIAVSNHDGSFHAELYPGEHSVTFLAEDTLGNRTQKEMNSAGRKIELAALNLSGITEAGAVLSLKNSDQPEIRLSKPLSNEIFTNATPLEFTIASESTILALDINGKSLLKTPGLWITCSIFVPLEQGLNRFTIKAATETGKAVEKTIVLNRKIPEHLKLAHRYGISMYTFDNNEKADNWKNFLRSFENDFAANRRFRLISKGLNNVMAESPGASCASALFGSVYKTGHGTEVVARLIDKKTSEIITVQDAFSLVSDMTYIGNRLSEKFHRKFPLTTGTITTAGGFFSFGGFKVSMDRNISRENPETRIKSGWPLLVYRGTRGGPTEIIAANCIKGKCAEFYNKGNKPGIGDKVITQ
ncbi:hypothetical protein [Desulfobacter curvatus]|uniref:hypothetical protein n=1 Tax=Desulfobacter curvatus TaxID=2290 RepID=UPI000373F99B|nr:hypothetical protein [Desulfobacter curvatus]